MKAAACRPELHATGNTAAGPFKYSGAWIPLPTFFNRMIQAGSLP